ncbi:hypothetical protein [Agrobacterium tumefaciens]|uniref:hypothetical protein n=1 Tax=Agrobacterium tumefaciens TaxID=358 RepID=UPI002789B070|nr:hypothetical protein [Agrobacterium tumefaciens]MDP9789284.1 hypothetical protein [Agrobacterium tumefaciens]
MNWQDNVSNLIKIGMLHKTPYVEEDVSQYIDNAKAYLNDAERSEYPGSRFQLAYEGMHALSLAVLNKIEVRGDSAPGHRQTAFQTALLVIEIDKLQKGASALISNLHKRRNTDTYRSPFPPITSKEAEFAVQSLELMLAATTTFLEKASTP